MNRLRPAARGTSARRRAAAVLAGGLLAGALAALAAAPAIADDGPAMQLSTDGIHFTQGQEPTVFPQLAGLVPGESRPGTVWVRNAGNRPAAFDLAVRSGAGSAVLTESLELLAGSPGHATVTVPLADPGQCHSVLHDWTLAPGATIRLDLALGLNLAATNETRREQSGVELVFLMQESGGGTAVTACPQPGEPAGGAGQRQPAATGVFAVAPPEASPTRPTASPARPAAGAPSGVGRQEGQALREELHSNVVGNDQRPAELLTAVGALFFFAALITRRRNP